ncbi:alpha-hydroxy acid oxidase [Rhizobium sp. C4]|uniref:alpha-hydroxy acid oxidase n=1 Tax=Rhizobium sp. C4 TaxID=1349800 RepID=UPI001E2C9140|nr:alpha-hydroxy acid oxidase [Rhizobium sp. C4]MCD2172072.1 alpha-hydroxy-acid oxidizing protein [Rhizobium sp. C4]
MTLRRVEEAISIEDFRKMARARLPRAVFDFVDGGAADELTLKGNRAAFDRLSIVPRILTDVSAPDISSTFMGQEFPTPLVISPMGSCSLVRPDADLAIARAAATRGIPYTLSTMSSTSIETMARSVSGVLWFQLYVLKDRAFNEKLLQRAQENGYSALVLTLDLQAGGKREKDLRNGVSVPLRPSPGLAWSAIRKPGWLFRMMVHGSPQFENVRGYLGNTSAGLTIAARVGANLDAGFAWEDFDRMREMWRGKLIVKGVNHPDDAKELIRRGADGLWISNHGGRQLDGAIASIEALSNIRKAVPPQTPMLLDSGIRRGTDLMKLRAYGASLGAVGRAALYAAAMGPEGPARALDILLDELRLGLKLSGAPSFRNINDGLFGQPVR